MLNKVSGRLGRFSEPEGWSEAEPSPSRNTPGSSGQDPSGPHRVAGVSRGRRRGVSEGHEGPWGVRACEGCEQVHLKVGVKRNSEDLSAFRGNVRGTRCGFRGGRAHEGLWRGWAEDGEAPTAQTEGGCQAHGHPAGGFRGCARAALGRLREGGPGGV